MAELILDVHAQDPGPIQCSMEARLMLHTCPQQRGGVTAGEDVTRKRRVLLKV